jgi:hypothetical protein
LAYYTELPEEDQLRLTEDGEQFIRFAENYLKSVPLPLVKKFGILE